MFNKYLKKNTILILLSLLMSTTQSYAQKNQMSELDMSKIDSQSILEKPLEVKAFKACPMPISINESITSNPSVANAPVASPDISEFPTAFQSGIAGSVLNQASMNKYFGHTIKFKIPSGDCCQYNQGQLIVEYKALATSNKDGSSSNNDGSFVFYKKSDGSIGRINHTHSPITGHIWGANASAATVNGQKVSRTFIIPPAAMKTGKISLFAQDDTAVLSFKLNGTGCCVQPTKE